MTFDMVTANGTFIMEVTVSATNWYDAVEQAFKKCPQAVSAYRASANYPGK